MDKPKPQCWVCPGAAHVYDGGHCDEDDDDVETSFFEHIENGILHKYFMRNTGVKYPEELPTDAWRTIVNRPGSNGKQLDDRDNFDYSSLEPGTFVVHIPRTRSMCKFHGTFDCFFLAENEGESSIMKSYDSFDGPLSIFFVSRSCVCTHHHHNQLKRS